MARERTYASPAERYVIKNSPKLTLENRASLMETLEAGDVAAAKGDLVEEAMQHRMMQEILKKNGFMQHDDESLKANSWNSAVYRLAPLVRNAISYGLSFDRMFNYVINGNPDYSKKERRHNYLWKVPNEIVSTGNMEVLNQDPSRGHNLNDYLDILPEVERRRKEAEMKNMISNNSNGNLNNPSGEIMYIAGYDNSTRRKFDDNHLYGNQLSNNNCAQPQNSAQYNDRDPPYHNNYYPVQYNNYCQPQHCNYNHNMTQCNERYHNPIQCTYPIQYNNYHNPIQCTYPIQYNSCHNPAQYTYPVQYNSCHNSVQYTHPVQYNDLSYGAQNNAFNDKTIQNVTNIGEELCKRNQNMDEETKMEKMNKLKQLLVKHRMMGYKFPSEKAEHEKTDFDRIICKLNISL